MEQKSPTKFLPLVEYEPQAFRLAVHHAKPLDHRSPQDLEFFLDQAEHVYVNLLSILNRSHVIRSWNMVRKRVPEPLTENSDYFSGDYNTIVYNFPLKTLEAAV